MKPGPEFYVSLEAEVALGEGRVGRKQGDGVRRKMVGLEMIFGEKSIEKV
jgi:hypothetical protein